MKISLVCLLLVVAAAQARDWYKVRPIQRTVTPRADAPQRTGRIIGGDYATLGQFPYQIGLFADDSRFCGGSLISADTVLTAAHCSQGARSHEVHAGALNIYEETEAGRVIVTSRNNLIHEDYDAFTLENDLSLIFLDSSISGPNIATIRLPSRSMSGETFEGQVARSSGWGYKMDVTRKSVAPGVCTNEEEAKHKVRARMSVALSAHRTKTKREVSGSQQHVGGYAVYNSSKRKFY